MKTITFDIAEPLYQEVEALARRTNREPAEVITEFLHKTFVVRSAPTHSVLDIKSFPLGPPIQPSTSRAEMLEGP